MDLYTFLKRLPKVSLHVHLAGTVQPSTLVALAGKNGVTLPTYREPENLYNYPDFPQFIQMLDRVMASIVVMSTRGCALPRHSAYAKRPDMPWTAPEVSVEGGVLRRLSCSALRPVHFISRVCR